MSQIPTALLINSWTVCFHLFTDVSPPSPCFIDYNTPVFLFSKCFQPVQLNFHLAVVLYSPHSPCKGKLKSHGGFLSVQESPASPSTESMSANLEPCGCCHQNGGDEHVCNLHKTPFNEADPPPDGSPFTMAFQCFRWNKDVTIMIVYEMRVNKLALHQRAFYSREDYNKDRRCIVTPILPHFHNNAALWLQWARNQERDLQMFYLWADFSVSKKGEGLLQVIDGSINSPN